MNLGEVEQELSVYVITKFSWSYVYALCYDVNNLDVQFMHYWEQILAQDSATVPSLISGQAWIPTCVYIIQQLIICLMSTGYLILIAKILKN